MPDPVQQPDSEQRHPAHHRSGVAARLAGLPVETLRVWERRYALCDTARSARGQRLYSDAQVRRLRLLKQLVDQGHPIGALAPLTDQQLGELTLTGIATAAPRPLRLAAIGHSLVARLQGGMNSLALDIVAHCAGLQDAADAVQQHAAQVLLIDMSELEPVQVAAICALRRQLQVGVVVLYRFAASAEIRQLRNHGCVAARAMADAGEIALLCRAAVAQLPTAALRPGPATTARRFDDTTLAAITAASSKLHCECPRHLSEILLMLNSFERYSAQCAVRSSDDALLHEYLGQAAASARTVLEDALERLALTEGLTMPAIRPGITRNP